MSDEIGEDLKLWPAWRQAEADFLHENFAPGTTVGHEWFETRFGLQPAKTIAQFQQNQWTLMREMEALRDSLLQNHSIMLRPVRGLGYRIVPPSEQTLVAMKDRGKAIKRELRKLAREVSHVQMEQLTDAGRKDNADTVARLGVMASFLRKQFRLKKGQQ